jgi:hypothetical protein
VISVTCDGEYVDISGDCVISSSGTLRGANDWSLNGDLFNDIL